eukprot:403332608
MQQATQRTVSLFPYQDFRLTKIDYQKIITQSEPWIDTYFRPDKSSILDPSIPTPGRLKEWETFTWKRPKDVYGKGNYDLYKTIGPSDIRQGACGDCYFLSSIASLAENPDRVKAIFINKEINKAGCYAMNMYVNGEPQVIVVDDYFPFNERKNDWAFSRSSQEKELWVLLLEKAWAKIHGSYQRIEAGTTGEALPALTGAPSDFFYHSEAKNKEDVWNKIKEADQKNQIIATAVSSQRQGKSSSEMQSVGLVDAHAYSLISTHEVQDNAGKTIRLLKIRNPWGFKEWTGDWSDKSTKWTQDIKDELGFEDKDDGVFYISFDDYLNFFYITTICKYVQDNDLTVMPDEHAQNEYCIQKIVVHKDQLSLISIMVSQLHARIADLQMKGQYRYAPLKLILMKNVQTTGTSQNEPASDQLIFIDGAYICYQHAHIQLPKLTQGDYYVIFKADWLNDFHQERKLVMSIYAPDPFKIEKVSSQSFSYEFLGEIEDMLSNRIDEGFQYQLPEYDVDGIEEYNREQRKGIQALCIKEQVNIFQQSLQFFIVIYPYYNFKIILDQSKQILKMDSTKKQV